MPARTILMRLVTEVLRLKQAANLSHRQIARALRMGIGTATNYLAAAIAPSMWWMTSIAKRWRSKLILA